MKTKMLHAIILISLFFLAPPAFAAPMPEGYSGVVNKVDARFITIKGDLGAKVFDIRMAGVFGWPTRKKVNDVFKPGEKVTIYHFSDINSKTAIPALNVFYADKAKVDTFQKLETAASRPLRM